MDLGLSGKLALVTGSTAGIGFSVARQLARQGATVYVNGRTEARVQRASQQIGGANVKGVAAYGMSKTAQLAVARGLAESFPASGVTVNSVLPGPTESEAFGAFLDSMAAKAGTSKQAIADGFFASARPSSLLKRFATTDEVASMVTYLCSEAASATTGSSIRVDGGVVRSIA